MNTVERIELFQRELSYIFDNKLKEFAKILITDADEYFFKVPASSSGKYHPDFARGEGGLVRHTKAVAYFTNELIRANTGLGLYGQHEGDCLVVAAIAHDIKKQGNGEGHHTVKEHPTLAADYVWDEWEEKGKELVSEKDVKYIIDAVESHMGPWQEPKPTTPAQLTVFYADYIASRKEIVGIDFIDGGDNTPVEAPVEIPTPKMTVEEYVFDFGQTRGKTIKESYEANPGYIKWMANKADFNNVEVQNLVKEFLKTI